MDCSSTVVKYLVFIFNFLFFLAGGALIVIGSLAITNNEQVYENIVPDVPDVKGVAIVFLVVGSIITVISFFGCCGAMKESACLLNTFAVLLLLIVLAEVGVAITALVLRSNIKDSMTNSIATYVPGDNTWDNLQDTLRCCGVDGASDWSTNPTHSGGNTLPDSCCNPSASGCTTSSTTLNTKGCYTTMSRYYIIIGVVGIVLGLIQIIGIVFACCLSKQVK